MPELIPNFRRYKPKYNNYSIGDGLHHHSYPSNFLNSISTENQNEQLIYQPPEIEDLSKPSIASDSQNFNLADGI